MSHTMSDEMILGTDWLQRHQLVVDLPNRELWEIHGSSSALWTPQVDGPTIVTGQETEKGCSPVRGTEVVPERCI